MCILGDLALNPCAFLVQHVTQGLQLADQPIDLLHRRAGYPLQQRRDVVCDQLAVHFGRATEAGAVPADEFPDLSLDRHFCRLVEIRSFSANHKCHVAYPHMQSAPCAFYPRTDSDIRM